ncbi:hypothetical protein S83_051144 [Arachis hypogaea]
MNAKPGLFKASYHDQNDLVPFDLKGVWTSLEQCHKLGLAKSIGVSNFSINKLQHFLSFATILLAVSQIDLKHIFCKMFVRSTQKNCQTMKRRSKASLKSIFTPTKRSAIVLLEVGLREKVATALSAPSATKHWEHLQLC